jgi:membrane protein DedA with SNARE-associated domain
MDFSTPAAALASVKGISYVVLFCLFFIEGPVVNFIAAFASSLGFFNVFAVLALAVLGNTSADLMYFYIGRLGKNNKAIQRYLERLLKKRRMNDFNCFLKENPGKAIATIKLTPFLPSAGIITVGMANVPVKKYLSVSIMVDVISCTIITILGYYSGALFNTMLKNFELGLYAVGFVAIFTFAFWYVLKIITARISKKIEKI